MDPTLIPPNHEVETTPISRVHFLAFCRLWFELWECDE